MLSSGMLKSLNQQMNRELQSSLLYLQMSGWAESNKFPGVAAFLKKHADEERFHMDKMFQYICEKGEQPVVSSLPEPKHQFEDVYQMIEAVLEHEKEITRNIGELALTAMNEKDMTTFSFLNWFLDEQREEEALFSGIQDKLSLLSRNENGLSMFDDFMKESAQSKVVPSVE